MGEACSDGEKIGWNVMALKLWHISGKTYYIDCPSVVGVYLFDSRYCLLIDTGSSRECAAAILELLDERGIRPFGIINTHFHADHCAGNRLIQERSNCRIFASQPDACFIQNPILAPFVLFSAYPHPPLKNRLLLAQPSRVTDIVEEGALELAGATFQVIDLRGHTLGQIGIVTPDGVAFLGDALIAPEIMERFRFHYLADLGSHFKTLDFLSKAGFERAVLAHGGPLENLRETVDRNRELFSEIIALLLEILKTPRSREEVLFMLVDALSLPMNTTQYYLIMASVSAFLSYLCTKRLIAARITDGSMEFSVV
ncbi:MAG: MBL fold metallo-hydrolase [Thermacetogeniaceae bacterium]